MKRHEEPITYEDIMTLANACTDIEVFAKTWFPRYFYEPFAEFHRELHKLGNQEKFLCIAAPRNHAKTTNFTLLKTLFSIAYRLKKFILIISDTYDQAVLFLESIKNELENNDNFKLTYQLSLKINREDRILISCGDEFEIFIRAMGAGQKLRGLKFREQRPDLIICDDIENNEGVLSADRRKKLKRWFFGALIPALAQTREDKESDNIMPQVIIIGTVLHHDSLLSNV